MNCRFKFCQTSQCILMSLMHDQLLEDSKTFGGCDNPMLPYRYIPDVQHIDIYPTFSMKKESKTKTYQTPYTPYVLFQLKTVPRTLDLLSDDWVIFWLLMGFFSMPLNSRPLITSSTIPFSCIVLMSSSSDRPSACSS